MYCYCHMQHTEYKLLLFYYRSEFTWSATMTHSNNKEWYSTYTMIASVHFSNITHPQILFPTVTFF